MSFHGILEVACSGMSLEECELFVTCMWVVWFLMNKMVMGDEDRDATTVLHLSFAWAIDFIYAGFSDCSRCWPG